MSERCRLGEMIAARREERGLSLRAFAKEIGLSPSYLSEIETGAKSPPDEIVERIFHALGTRADRDLWWAAAGIIEPGLRGAMLASVAAWRDVRRTLESADPTLIAELNAEIAALRKRAQIAEDAALKLAGEGAT